MPKKLTPEQLLERSKHNHKNFYDYSLFICVNSKSISIIICPIHGQFEQRIDLHSRGHGCNKCNLSKKHNLFKTPYNKFIEKTVKTHGYKYDYSKFIYVNNKTKGIIVCKEHGDFYQTPDKHINKKQGCSKCGGRHPLNTEDFIKKSIKINGNLYSYDKSVYINNDTLLIITCYKHGDFLQTPDKHLNAKHGCHDCGGSKKLSTIKFIEKSIKNHGYEYGYNKSVYKNRFTELIVTCFKHGDFLITPASHNNNLSGCPLCLNKNESFIQQYFIKNDIKYIYQYKLPIIKKKRNIKSDFYLSDYNLIIEYNGKQHYDAAIWYTNGDLDIANKKLKDDQERDQKVRDYCKQHNINLLEIDGRKYAGKKLKKYLEQYFFRLKSRKYFLDRNNA